MILVTGAAGFIGSCLLATLNDAGFNEIIAVDNLGTAEKWKNLRGKNYLEYFSKTDFLKIIQSPNAVHTLAEDFTFIFHMGACSSTTEKNVEYLIENNFKYSVALFKLATKLQIPFVYASSAATYGSGSDGFDDDMAKIPNLKPLNPYGYSKQLFDMWALKQTETPPFWCGLKFFNVYGPNEYHKDGQFSVIYKAFQEITQTGSLNLFKSYRNDFCDGEQKRDFIYVKDVTNVLLHLYQNFSRASSGIYNLGTGRAETFLKLAHSVFAARGKEEIKINWIEMPEALRSQYQYFTEATMLELPKNIGYTKPFYTLENGISDYIKSYLVKADVYL